MAGKMGRYAVQRGQLEPAARRSGMTPAARRGRPARQPSDAAEIAARQKAQDRKAIERAENEGMILRCVDALAA
ncbi:hypothetical protein [Marinimicrococcus flavescens]|uniref:Uncharacterized protein n=1 Tax=Marinimicrococcus flavescens TaxID=3031815 RepID=A0AAP4D5L5_9PROT|nr:hypothetical protein [Marinimicrococcus flavescens]